MLTAVKARSCSSSPATACRVSRLLIASATRPAICSRKVHRAIFEIRWLGTSKDKNSEALVDSSQWQNCYGTQSLRAEPMKGCNGARLAIQVLQHQGRLI